MTDRTTLRKVITALAGFAAAAVCAHFQEWDARTMIWGLWGSSLIVGYAWGVSLLAATVIRAEREGRTDYPRSGAVALGIFLTVHFVGFHWGHSAFLNAFYPLHDKGSGPIGMAYTLRIILTTQWGLILGTLISRFYEFPRGGLVETESRSRERQEEKEADPLFAPYRNVVRMHIMIFALIGITIIRTALGKRVPALQNSEALTLYAILLLYFFPWNLLKRKRVSARET